MFSFLLPHLFHALSHNEGTCESRQACSDILNTLCLTETEELEDLNGSVVWKKTSDVYFWVTGRKLRFTSLLATLK